ncbi:hypothetical protein D7X25_37245 [bacterium 1XD42-8]|nr:hypothetical protein D7X25_37245 [bacterium 1XD42-8]
MLFTEWNWNDAMKIEREEGREEGRVEGQAEGERKRSIDIAKKLLAMGFDLDAISKGTGLTIEQIQGL